MDILKRTAQLLTPTWPSPRHCNERRPGEGAPAVSCPPEPATTRGTTRKPPMLITCLPDSGARRDRQKIAGGDDTLRPSEVISHHMVRRGRQ
jgi:hypothetical protein